ncbi:PRC-barrel domain-containing protein [Arthrobacter sp. NPDC056493]|uniref:PRC-barrel domain-containing protein n=1 Tax=Arthrobacter sp. NPDC056493 TaxID=3345839 RepID=UPI00366FE598
MLAKEHIDDLINKNGNILSADGRKIGSLGQVYADDDNGQPTWVTARTGLFGTSEDLLHEHYQVKGTKTYTEARSGHTAGADDSARRSAASLSATERDAGFAAAGDGETYGAAAGAETEARSAAGLVDGNATTRSEERVNVGTQRQAAGEDGTRR